MFTTIVNTQSYEYWHCFSKNGEEQSLNERTVERFKNLPRLPDPYNFI